MKLKETIDSIRSDFPVLASDFEGRSFVYLDNAASTQKPKIVSDTIKNFYESHYATVHRGVYTLSQENTDLYNTVRQDVAAHINASSDTEIVFTKGATEAINLVAHSYAGFLEEGDEIVVSELEHHANFVPWQQLAKKKGLVLRYIRSNDRGELILDDLDAIITDKTKLVAVGHVSNVLGTIHPIKEIINCAHRKGAVVLIDGCQAVPHMSVDVQELDCDFYCFSAHKMYGPTGVGVLYGKAALLDKMPPYQMGGDMIESVSLEDTHFAKAPVKFEAGTPPIAEVLGLGAALTYMNSIGLENIQEYEDYLLAQATDALLDIEGLQIIGTAKDKASVISFLIGDIHAHDIGTILDSEGICVRAGHHCSQITMQRFGLSATARASFSFYNQESDIQALVAAIYKAKEIFG